MHAHIHRFQNSLRSSYLFQTRRPITQTIVVERESEAKDRPTNGTLRVHPSVKTEGSRILSWTGWVTHKQYNYLYIRHQEFGVLKS